MNLVGNAVKFTNTGVIGISAFCCGAKDDRTLVRIEITDTGIGISEAVIDKLFTSFTQGDASVSRKFGGTGLGLSISKNLMELMAGTIGVTSTLGQGSTFWIELEMEEGSPPHVSDLKEGTEQADTEPSQLRILVAEDNPVNQAFVEHVLVDAGHRVDIVENGRQAVSAVSNLRYDLVLMDIQMPEMDGVKATHVIRALQSPAHSIPIIAVTANVSIDDRRQYISAGMNKVVSKPFGADTIYAAIVEVLEARSSTAPASLRLAANASNVASSTNLRVERTAA